MTPGSLIQCALSASTQHRGSVGWLARKGADYHFTTARHVAFFADTPATSIFYGTGTFDDSPTVAGTNALLDTCLLKLRAGLTPPRGPVTVQGTGATIIRIWDPRPLMQEYQSAQMASDQDAIKNRTMQVCHAGAATAQSGSLTPEFNGVLNTGGAVMGAQRLQMRTRPTRRGDSGGPVYNQANELVGFVSMGGDSDISDDTVVVLAYYVFEALGCEPVFQV